MKKLLYCTLLILLCTFFSTNIPAKTASLHKDNSIETPQDKQHLHKKISEIRVIEVENKIIIKDSLYVSPNPIKNKLKVSLPYLDNDSASLELFNIVGDSVMKVQALKENLIDMSIYDNGLYFLKIDNKGTVNVKKILKI
ncbi:MAG: T9SS type A sorting domain-containing protein [Hyphomicrobiales bacterium]